MFSFIRRISHGVIPRPDRPWEDDPTSNAPRKGRKRRLSSTEPDQEMEDEQTRMKRSRGESVASTVADDHDATSSVVKSPDAEGVKEVTQGVEEVELGEKKEEHAVVAPESIPLPAEEADELDELEGSSSVPLQPDEAPVEGGEEDVEEKSGDEEAEEGSAKPQDDDASSHGDVDEEEEKDAEPVTSRRLVEGRKGDEE